MRTIIAFIIGIVLFGACSEHSEKPKITIQYEKRYKEIDNASAIGIVNEFKGIFAKDSIR